MIAGWKCLAQIITDQINFVSSDFSLYSFLILFGVMSKTNDLVYFWRALVNRVFPVPIGP